VTEIPAVPAPVARSARCFDGLMPDEATELEAMWWDQRRRPRGP
jgi:hypothetical protein